jgi:biopolymer transport protein ExbB
MTLYSNVFCRALYFERLMAINAASHIDSNFMSQIRDNIRNGRIDNAKIACAHSNLLLHD